MAAARGGETGAGPGVVQVPVLPGWRHLIYCRKTEGNLEFSARWVPQTGLSLCVRQQTTGRVVALYLNRLRFRAEELQTEAAPQREITGTRFLPDHLVAGPKSSVSCTLKLRTNNWYLYLDDQLCATLAAPFEAPVDFYEQQAPGQQGAVQGKVIYRPVPIVNFRTGFMIEAGATDQLYPWKVQSGHWRIHTAQEDALARPEDNIKRIEEVPLTPDKSPNFYSLKGSGQDAIITYGYNFFDDYSFQASMLVNEGDVGLIFYHKDAKNHYGFTIHMAKDPQKRDLRLWRMRNGVTTLLARVHVPLYLNQWHLPKVVVRVNQITCYFDGVEVMHVNESLPPGGKVGLYANTRSETRFDDVYLHAVENLPMKTVRQIRYQTLYQKGQFYRDRSFWHRATPLDSTQLQPPVSGNPQMLVLGRAQDRNAVFSADFQVPRSVYDIGLVAGFRGPHQPYYLLTLHHTPATETYRVASMTDGKEKLLQSWTQNAYSGNTGGEQVSLMADATQEGVLRFLKNNKLVCIVWLQGPVVGGAGPYVGSSTKAVVSNLSFDFDRHLVHELQQKNPIFRHDSFMRHWASPEGQWIAGAGGYMWHKGDFFGDYTIRLPCIPGSELHVGVQDGKLNGPVFVAVKKNSLELNVTAGLGAQPYSYSAALTPPAGKTVSDMDYEFHHEGHWIWVVVDGKPVIVHRLQMPFIGTRCRTKGLSLTDLARSKVTRINVIDDFFNQSPYNWIVNGGEWQIVNRFQCTPSWSHMIGQSANTLAALWYKKVFTGNLDLEFYAGTRHEWYARAGDYDCTVMANTTSAGKGYTVTCTQWDQNLSQNWTTLYRNGQVIQRSDAYMVPRRRAGMVRKFLNPLVSLGRPIHGAWFYIKLRKIGDKLEYYFDNQKIFEVHDPHMIEQGLVGIWTFMQSMVVAQVKITYQHDKTLSFPVEKLPLNVPATEPLVTPKKAPPASPQWDILTDNVPLDNLDPALWSHNDPVGQSVMQSFRMNAAGLRVVNRLGAGRLYLASDLPPVPLAKLAGWRFLVKRSPGAMFNVSYTVGRGEDNGSYSATHNYFEQITGDDFNDGAYTLTGRATVPAATDFTSPAGNWVPVTVWVPSRYRSADDAAEKVMVHLEGFGIKQPSTTMCGIPGNAPGDGYAVRQLTPIFYGVPRLSRTGTTGARQITLRREEGDAPVSQTQSLAEAQKALAGMSHPGLNTVWVTVSDGKGNSFSHSLCWIDLPKTLQTEVTWAPHRADSLLLTAQPPYVDKRFCSASVSLDGRLLAMDASNQEERIVRLPRNGLGSASQPLKLTVDSGAGETHVVLNWDKRKVNDKPVLMALKGLPSGIDSFENGVGNLAFTDDGRMSILHDDPVQGNYLQVRNRALGQRMAAGFSSRFSIAEYPLMMFRYRAFDMTHLSVAFNNHHYVRLNHDSPEAVQVRFSQDLNLDQEWHSWEGFVADAFNGDSYSVSRFSPTAFDIESVGYPDQTGRYSKWHLDDLLFGPAVSQAGQLDLTPVYYDSDGVKSVLCSVSDSDACYADLDASAVAALQWQPSQPGSPLAPSLKGLADGVHHLFLKAVDTTGVQSSVTDVPFLLDTKPLTVTHSFSTMSNPQSNGRELIVTFDNQGASPWDIAKATFSVAGSRQALPAWTSIFRHDASSDKLILNYPFIFRRQLDRAKNGDTLEFAIDNIVDGAGNRSPRVTIPIKVDYATDKVGPAWYAFSFGRSVNWFWNWDGYRAAIRAFEPGSRNTATVYNRAGTSPFLITESFRSQGELSRRVDWQPAKYPWLSCRMDMPTYNPRRRILLRFVLTTTANKTYTISLTHPGHARNELNRDRTIDWTAGQWQRLSFNVRDMMKNAGLSDQQIADTTIREITIQRRGTRNRERLYLDDFFLHGAPADPSRPDFLKWRAYDASGVASLEATCVDADGKALWHHTFTSRSANLNELRPRIKGCAWFRCQAKDKAGNLSVPFWMPVAS